MHHLNDNATIHWSFICFVANTVLLYFECRTFTCNRISLQCGIVTFTKVKDLNLNTSSEEVVLSTIVGRKTIVYQASVPHFYL